MLRAILLKFAESPGFAHWVTSKEIPRRMALRFVAGEALDEAIAAARACNSVGMYASLDYLGENVATVADAQRARDAYLETFDRIAQERLHANVSCKLTQLGLDLSSEFCKGLLLSIVERAAALENFLRVHMKSSVYTARTIDLFKRVTSLTPPDGTAIQSSLNPSTRTTPPLPPP